MGIRNTILLTVALILTTVPPVAAFVLHTSARVEIVPCVDVGCPDPRETTDRTVYRIMGPPDRTVNIVLTTSTHNAPAAAETTSDTFQHDHAGECLVRLEDGAASCHLLIEYE